MFILDEEKHLCWSFRLFFLATYVKLEEQSLLKCHGLGESLGLQYETHHETTDVPSTSMRKKRGSLFS